MKKTSYNEKSREELVLELAKLRSGLTKAKIEKMKTGKAVEYRTTRKNIARVLTAMNHEQNKVPSVTGSSTNEGK